MYLIKNRSLVFIGVFAAVAVVLVLVIFAGRQSTSFEAEEGSSSLVVDDSTASNGQFIQFGTGSDLELPEPINPSSNRLNDIIDDFPNGGVIVIPDGTYIADDLEGFRPSSRLFVIAETRNGVQVERRANSFGNTHFLVNNSSNITFIGVHFKDITTSVRNSEDIEFKYTRHSYPVTASPDPTRTECGRLWDPTAVDVNVSNNVNFYGVDLVGFGHDGFKLSRVNGMNVVGTVITGGDHGGLQNGRGNETCGWDGDDNYHNDGVQFYPGGVNNLTIDQSYIGRRFTMGTAPERNGGWGYDLSNKNLVFSNNWFYVEPTIGHERECVQIDARIRSNAPSGTTMDFTMTNNIAWCNTSNWILHVGGTANNVFSINGDFMQSNFNNVPQYFDEFRANQAPVIEDSPAYDWRAQNSYESVLAETI